MDLQNEIKAMQDKKIRPFSLLCQDIVSCYRNGTVAVRTELAVNSMKYGCLTESDYGAIAERSKRCILLSEKALQYASDALDKYEKKSKTVEWISVKCPAAFLIKTDPLAAINRTFGKKPGRIQKLCIELPLRSLYADGDELRQQLNKLHSAGVKTMLSDFGDEFAPTMRLASFPFDYLILHPEALSGIRNKDGASELLMSTLRTLNINAIACDVSKESDVELCREAGCYAVIFSAPASKSEVRI